MGLSLTSPSLGFGLSNSIRGALGLPGASYFHPWELFANGEQGAWYDPSDFERYMSKGPEVLANPGPSFTSMVEWVSQSNTATLALSGGAITATRVNAASSWMLQDAAVPLVAGKWYIATAEVASSGGYSTSISIYDNTAAAAVSATSTSNSTASRGTIEVVFRAANTGTYLFNIQQSAAAPNGTTCTLYSASIRELTSLPTATLFQDAAGTTPVTAMEQPVGLMLDKRLGLVRGVELVTNGTFDNGTTGWTTVAASLSVTGDKWGKITADGSQSAQVSQAIPAAAYGRWLEIKASYRNLAASRQAKLTLYTTVDLAAHVSTNAAGSLRAVAYLPANTSAVLIGLMSNSVVAGESIEWDGFSVRELPGNHALQTTTTARPLLSARKNLTMGTPDFTGWTKRTSITWNGGVLTNNGNLTPNEGVFYNNTLTANAQYTFSVRAKAGTITSLRLIIKDANADTVRQFADFVLDGIERVYSISGTTAGAAAGFRAEVGTNGIAGTIHVSEPQVEFGSTATRYQRVTTSTDYDWVGFPIYLRRDGTDDWMSFTLPAALTAGTIAHAITTENTGTVYGPNTVHVTNNVGFGLADASAIPGTQAISGNGTVFTASGSATTQIVPHVGLATANGTTVRIRANLGAAVSTGSVTNFNGSTWRIGRTLNDEGIHKGNDYGCIIVNRVLSANEEISLIRHLASKAGISL